MPDTVQMSGVIDNSNSIAVDGELLFAPALQAVGENEHAFSLNLYWPACPTPHRRNSLWPMIVGDAASSQ